MRRAVEKPASLAKPPPDLLVKLNRTNEAHTEFERAATLTRNARERDLLLKRAEDCA